jgi:hypothetical protein
LILLSITCRQFQLTGKKKNKAKNSFSRICFYVAKAKEDHRSFFSPFTKVNGKLFLFFDAFFIFLK